MAGMIAAMSTFAKGKKKVCSKCGNSKLLSEFSPSAACKDGVRGTCKKCASAWASAWQRRKSQTLWGKMRFIVASARNRAKERGMPFDLENEFLVEKYQSQNGRCAVSGLPFKLYDDIALIRISPYLPSLDRIDSNKGYTKNNVQFVLWAINVGKSDWPLKEVLPIWQAAVKNSKIL